MLPIIQKSDPILKRKAKDVSLKQFGSEELFRLIQEMKETLRTQEDGVALAAPQIGSPLRIFVVAPRVFEIQRELKNEKRANENEEIATSSDEHLVYINPTLTKLSRKKRLVDEGCLSIRNYYGKVSRAEKATVEAYDEYGKKFTRGGTDLLAQIFQHEVDHLNGTLFIDKAEDLYYLPQQPPKKK